MRESGKIVANVLKLLKSYIKPEVSTFELDKVAEDYILSEDGIPVFKGYGPKNGKKFPSSICVSIDDEVVHGIPSGRKLKEGEIVSIDVGVLKNKFVADGAWTFSVGKISDEKEKLMKVTEESLYEGIKQAKSGNYVYDISVAVQKKVENNGYSVVKELVGHGVGRSLHEDPQVPNYAKKNNGIKLKTGMTIAIEPMVNFGSEKIYVDVDEWTVKTQDKSPSAHFEHTVAIMDGETDILTL